MLKSIFILLCFSFTLQAGSAKIVPFVSHADFIKNKCLMVFGKPLDYYEGVIDEFPRWEVVLTKSLRKASVAQLTNSMVEFIVTWNLKGPPIKLSANAFFYTTGRTGTILDTLDRLIDVVTIRVNKADLFKKRLILAKSMDEIIGIIEDIEQYREDLYSLLLLQEIKERLKIK